ncbi:MAG: NAD-dependent epimerase/dehydratase family protein [Acidimicrobiaceae bacterium]|nr:NAD-dependent epimerase/dehydratase family protein [Acidimicrobiaceae bacterium]
MVDLLVERGYQVRVIDNLSGGHKRNLKQHDGNSLVSLDERDIRSIDPSDPLFSQVEVVFHFAGIGDIVPSIEHPTEYMDVNVQGTVRMLEGARYAGANKFVYAASSSCYGLADVPTTENNPVQPAYPYALSKYLGEMAAFHWNKVYGLPVNSIRIFNAFGTRSRTSGAYGAVFGVFLRQKISGAPYTVVGDGMQSRDFVYVTDLALAFLAASLTTMDAQIWNVGRGDPQPVNRLVELLGGEVVNVPKRPGEPDCTWADISKIARDLDWTPLVTFEEGVRRMVENLDYWADAPLWDADSIAEATLPWFTYLGND